MIVDYDTSGYYIAKTWSHKAVLARAEADGLIRVARRLGEILKKIDPDNEYLKRKKIDEVYNDTKLEISSPFK